ncbi:hypothetical protein MMC19_006352 [Ptychographa xylographoides]|nr:hypothetical protein [Ptychographa xylographoides]
MPTNPVFRAGAVALITGGAGGIGLAVARVCARHGMRLALIDNNAVKLSAAKSSLDEVAGEDVVTYDIDVSKIADWRDVKSSVEQKFGGVDFLMLNAGIGIHGSWEDVDYFRTILNTNLYGVINGIATFLPIIKSSSSPTSIIITGSKQGITNPPGNVAYNISKSAIKTLAEQLSYDLRSTTTSVHLLIPGWTYTSLTGGSHAEEKPAGAWTPEQVAQYLEAKMGEDIFYVLCPDNDVSVDKDRRRMVWGVGDIVNERPPLTRWREDWKERAEKGMSKIDGEGFEKNRE